MAGRDDYLWDGSGSDPEVERLEELLRPLAAKGEVPALPDRRRTSWVPWAAVAAVVLVAVGVGVQQAQVERPGSGELDQSLLMEEATWGESVPLEGEGADLDVGEATADDGSEPTASEAPEVALAEAEADGLEPEPKRSGGSGNWYEVTIDCVRCPTLLNQGLGIEAPTVMRRYYDFFRIDPDRESGTYVFPSVGESRPLGVAEEGDRLVVWQYAVERGDRLTDTYATLWDLQTLAGGGLLYGRKYRIQAWTDEAYGDWDEGYEADQDFIPEARLQGYADLPPVRELTLDAPRFQVGEAARISFVGYAAFVRSDVDVDLIGMEQERLRGEAAQDAARRHDQDEAFRKGEALLDDKKWEQALAAFEEARALGMGGPDLWYHLGFTHYQLKDYEAAKRYYRAILEVDPRDTDVRFNLARIHEKQEDWDAAIREYEAVLEVDPDDAGSRDRLELLRAARDLLGGR